MAQKNLPRKKHVISPLYSISPIPCGNLDQKLVTWARIGKLFKANTRKHFHLEEVQLWLHIVSLFNEVMSVSTNTGSMWQHMAVPPR